MSHLRIVIGLLAVVSGGLAPGDLRAQVAGGLEVRVAAPQPAAAIRADTGFELALSRPLTPGVERLAILVGPVDWSGLFVADGTVVRYRPGPVRLPAGEVPLAVYLVTAPTEWSQVLSTTVRVLTPLGFEKASVVPRASVTYQGQVAERHSPESNAPPRSTYHDVNATIGLRTEHVRNGVVVETQTNLLGVTNQAQAVRFGTEGEQAPHLDLADYVWRVKGSHVELAAGHGQFTAARHLLADTSSRGLSFAARGSRADLRLGTLSATSVAGFDNFLGVTTPEHRVSFAVAGFELAPRAGAARVEISAVGGSRQPLAGYSQGQVNDADRSRGIGVRFTGSDRSGRLRLNAGHAGSRSGNDEDPFLSQGLSLVPLEDRSSRASHLEAAADVVRNTAAFGGAGASLTGGYRYERVDPFFMSVGTAQAIRSDIVQQTVEANGALGRLTGQFSHGWSRDNLGEIASVLTTDAKTTALNLGLPTGGIRGGSTPAPWWPSLTYALGLSSQVGRGQPPSSGFTSASHVPDQQNATHTVRADWAVRQWRMNYGINRSLQDNRQAGRERADFVTLVHSAGIGVSAARWDASGEVAHEGARSVEFDETTRTWRLGATGGWRPTPAQAFLATTSWTRMRRMAVEETTAAMATVQYTFARTVNTRRRQVQFQGFGRSSWQTGSARSPFFEGVQDRSLWTFEIGGSFSL